MYSLDINFLNDRAERPTDVAVKSKATKQGSGPLLAGLVAAIALPALALGAWLFLQNRNAALEQQKAELDNQLTALQAQLDEIKSINDQVGAIESDNQALATVFDRIKPWSAVLQDIRDRVPNGVQIREIDQSAAEAQAQAAPAPSPSPAPGDPAALPTAPPASKVVITGQARSFNDVNDFILTLQRSPFLDPETTRLVSSGLADNQTQATFLDEEVGGDFQVEFPKVVNYTIESNLTDLPASELLQDLERTLSVGLASRIQALRDRGVLKP